MANVELVFMEDAYFLRCGAEESQAEEYGCSLDWTARDGRRFLALCDVKPHTDDVESLLDEWVYQVTGAVDVEIVEDEGEDEDDGEEIEIDAPDGEVVPK